MNDSIGKKINLRDIVLYSGYHGSWKYGIVVRTGENSTRILEDWYTYKNNVYYHYANKRSSSKILILEGSQVTRVLKTIYPFAATTWTLQEFNDKAEECIKALAKR